MARKKQQDPQAALDRAQDLVYDAWDADTAKRRVALAVKAAETSPLCADAFVILAEHAKPGSDEELDLWRRAVAAGEAALGKEGFEEFAGEFWGFLETRPYMRARLGLANALWDRGDWDEALSHFNAMLELNPNDNQGVRYVLAANLVEADKDDDLARLLKRYHEDIMAAWSWTTALAAFRREGDTDKSRKLLKKAFAGNEHVPAYSLEEKRLPKLLPPYMGIGNEDEAIHFMAVHGAGWKKTPGALDWVRTHRLAGKPKAKAAKPKRVNARKKG